MPHPTAASTPPATTARRSRWHWQPLIAGSWWTQQNHIASSTPAITHAEPMQATIKPLPGLKVLPRSAAVTTPPSSRSMHALVAAGWTAIAWGSVNQLLCYKGVRVPARDEARPKNICSFSPLSLSSPLLCAASSPPDTLLFVVCGGWRSSPIPASSSIRRLVPNPRLLSLLPNPPPPLPPPQSAASSPIWHRRAQEEPSIWGGRTRTGDCRDGDQGRGFGGCAHVEQRRTGEGHDSGGVPAGEREDEGERVRRGKTRRGQRRGRCSGGGRILQGRRRRSAASLGCRWSCFSVFGHGESRGGLVAAHSRPLCHKRSTHRWIKMFDESFRRLEGRSDLWKIDPYMVAVPEPGAQGQHRPRSALTSCSRSLAFVFCSPSSSA